MNIPPRKCSDIPDQPILDFLTQLDGKWATWFTPHPEMKMPSVLSVMPGGTTEKLALAKMRKLMKRGLVNGCGCGCRGDFVIAQGSL